MPHIGFIHDKFAAFDSLAIQPLSPALSYLELSPGDMLKVVADFVNTDNIKLLVHTIAGTLARLCGLCYVGYAVEIKPVVVPPFTIFPAFVAIAGISIIGGRGKVLNILGGAMLIAMTTMGATMRARKSRRGVLGSDLSESRKHIPSVNGKWELDGGF